MAKNKNCFLSIKSAYDSIKGSCDTADWSNDTENVAFLNKLHFFHRKNY